MNREQRREFDKKLRQKKNEKLKREKDMVDLITSTIKNKTSTRLKEVNLDHIQINYINIDELRKPSKTDLQYADVIRHDDINNLDYLQSIIYFGKDELTEDNVLMIARTCEQSKLHNWVYSDKDNVYLDKNALYIDHLEIEQVIDDGGHEPREDDPKGSEDSQSN